MFPDGNIHYLNIFVYYFMKPRYLSRIIIFVISFLCSQEIKHKNIPLNGLITNPKQEISGLDWYGENLVLLPENLGGYLFMIPKGELIASIQSKNPTPIEPVQTPFITPDYTKLISGFEGFESIAFFEDQFVVTLEAKHEGDMHGYIAIGTIDPETQKAILTNESPLELPMPVQIKNMTFESAMFIEDEIILIYEANGSNIRKSAWQYVVSSKDFSISKIDFPNIEYRITDVTRLDINNTFWAMNYLWPGEKEKLNPATDFISKKFGKGTTYKKYEAVERLIQFELTNGMIHLTDREPIEIELDEDGSRNWEGIVRLEKEGFLIVTDKYPGTLLGFVPTNLE